MASDMKKINIAVLVSGGGTNLQALIDAQESQIIKSGKISLVISSNPDAYALVRAKNAGIPTSVISKAECGSQDAFESAIIKKLTANKIDLIIIFVHIRTSHPTGNARYSFPVSIPSTVAAVISVSLSRKACAWFSGNSSSSSTSAPNWVSRMMPPKLATSNFTRS